MGNGLGGVLMAKTIHIAAAVIRKPVLVKVVGVEGCVVHRQRDVANKLVVGPAHGDRDIDVAAVFDVNTWLERVFGTAFSSARAGAEHIVGRAVFLNDNDDVAEGVWWDGLGVRECCRDGN